MSRRDRPSPFSLFSFQDIITGLCGIVILLVLVMVIDLVSRRGAPPPPPASTEAPDDPAATELALLRETEALEAAIARTRAELETRRVAAADGVSAERQEEADRDLSEKERRIAALLSQLDALRTRLEKARDADSASRRVLHEMEQTRRRLEEGLAAMKDIKGVTLIPERGNVKSPVYIVLGRGLIEIHRPLDKGARAVRGPQRDTAETVRSTLSKLDRTTHTVILIVRPSGASDMMPVAELVKGMGFACGRDPLEEDAEVSFGAPEGGST